MWMASGTVDDEFDAWPTQQKLNMRPYVGHRQFHSGQNKMNFAGHWWKFGINRVVLGGSNAVDVLAAILASADFPLTSERLACTYQDESPRRSRTEHGVQIIALCFSVASPCMHARASAHHFLPTGRRRSTG